MPQVHNKVEHYSMKADNSYASYSNFWFLLLQRWSHDLSQNMIYKNHMGMRQYPRAFYFTVVVLV